MSSNKNLKSQSIECAIDKDYLIAMLIEENKKLRSKIQDLESKLKEEEEVEEEEVEEEEVEEEAVEEEAVEIDDDDEVDDDTKPDLEKITIKLVGKKPTPKKPSPKKPAKYTSNLQKSVARTRYYVDSPKTVKKNIKDFNMLFDGI